MTFLSGGLPMASPDKKPSQDLHNFIWGKLRTGERKYQEQRQSAPSEFNSELGRKWFWIILVAGLMLPFTSLISLQLRQTSELLASRAFGDLLTMIFVMSILFVAPFLAYALHSLKRLRGNRSQLRPVVGGFVGLSAVYAFFYAIFLPWGVSLGSGDYAGMAQTMTVYFLFVTPLLGLGAIALGRKLAPPHLPVWVGGQVHDTKTEPEASHPTTLSDR